MQLVSGCNPNIPTTLTAQLPALETKPATPIIGMHIAALHSARQAFISAESSEKIKRALRKQTRQWEHNYQIGDNVYYKRDDDKRWKGPAKVLGQDGPVVFLRQGSDYIIAHLCRIQPVESLFKQDSLIAHRSSANDNEHVLPEPAVPGGIDTK